MFAISMIKLLLYIMGSNQSVGFQEINVKIDHPKFKKAYISLHNSASKLVSQLSIQELKYKKWQQLLSSDNLNPQFLLLAQKSQYHHQRFCSTHGTMKIVYDNFPYLLKNQICDRIGKKQFFTEQQIWYLIFAIFSAKKQFTDNKINHGNLGNLTSQNVFLSQKGQIKVGNVLSWPNQQMQQNKKIVSQENKRYLAPQDFIQLSLGMSYCKITNQSELFSIGLTLLSATTLKDNNQLYNNQNKKFNFNQLLSRIRLLNSIQRYSELLKAVVQLLCAFEPKQRLKTNQIGQIIFKSQTAIRNKSKFTVYPVARRIQQKIKQNRKNKSEVNKILPKNINQKLLQEIVKQQQCILVKSINSPRNISIKMPNGIQNSLNLTQVILAPPRNYSNQMISQNSNTQSLFSSIDRGIKFKKTISDPQQSLKSIQKQKNLQRYQLINANNNLLSNQTTISEQDFLNLVNFTKQIIVQKPIIIDKKRRSDDIQQEMTPVQTPNGTPLNRSQTKLPENTGFNRKFYIPNRMLLQRDSSKQLSKTTTLVINNSLHPQDNRILANNSADSPNKLRVNPSKSYNPHVPSDNSARQEIAKTINSTVTMYIPLVDGGSLYQSSMGSWQSPRNKLFSQDSSKKYMVKIPESSIQQRSKQCSQIHISQLTIEDKHRIRQQMINKIQNLINKVKTAKRNPKRIVTFAEKNQKVDMSHQSHQSKVLQIDDIDLQCLQQQNDFNNTDRIVVEYREPNQSHIVIESVKVCRNNSHEAV